MDEIKIKIKQILKDNFNLTIENDDEEFFHRLDSINYIKYVILIENNFNVTVTIDDNIRTVNQTFNFIKK